MATPRLRSIPHCGKKVRAKRGEALRYFREVVLAYEGLDCLPWPFSTNGGYGQMSYEHRPQLVPRLVCEAEYGSAPSPAHHAAHSCGKGNLGCVAKRHLSWKTPSENEADKLVHGTSPRGARCGTSKLTTHEVRQIRSLEGQFLQREIAAQFGVGRRTIGRIHRREIWTDV